MFRSTLVQWRSYAHYRMRRILSETKGLESVGRILLRGLERRFMRCFHMWRTAVHDYRVAWKTLCRIANAVLSSAFRHWHKYAVEFKERISKLPRLLIRAALSQMLSTFKFWHQAVRDYRLAWKTVCRIAHAVLSSEFRRWSKVTSSLAEKAHASKEIMLYIKRGLSALRGFVRAWVVVVVGGALYVLNARLTTAGRRCSSGNKPCLSRLSYRMLSVMQPQALHCT